MCAGRLGAGQQRTLRWMALVFAAAILMHHAHAIRFVLEKGQSRCFWETFADHSNVLGEYMVATGKGDMRVDLRITDDEGKELFAKTDMDHGKFEFQTRSGQHKANRPSSMAGGGGLLGHLWP